MRARVAGRPWGQLGWILESFPGDWGIIGCVSTEDRWIAAARLTSIAGRLGHHTFFRIAPTGMGSNQAIGHTMMGQQRALAKDLLGDDGEEHVLFERHQNIVAGIGRFIDGTGDNVLVDISCFPKRFFFPILKLITQQSTASNVAVCYTHAASYPSLRLSEDPEPEGPLPMFMGALPRGEAKILVVAAGAEPLGLSQVLESEGGYRELRVLYPYPAPPPLGRRNAEFLRLISQSVELSHSSIIGIDPHDVPQIFVRLQQIGRPDPSLLTLAPYGPKPVSLAMCLYVLSLDTVARPTVIYTQPKSYNPLYSVGIAQRAGSDHVTAYMVRRNGTNLYSSP